MKSLIEICPCVAICWGAKESPDELVYGLHSDNWTITSTMNASRSKHPLWVCMHELKSIEVWNKEGHWPLPSCWVMWSGKISQLRTCTCNSSGQRTQLGWHSQLAPRHCSHLGWHSYCENDIAFLHLPAACATYEPCEDIRWCNSIRADS